MPININDFSAHGGNVQRSGQRAAASEVVNTDGAAAAPAPSVLPNRQQRDARTGRYLPLEPDQVGARATHALHTDRLPAEFVHLREDMDRFLAGCESDEGGALDRIPARRRAQLEYRARVHRRILQLDSALELRGLIDKRGKLRAAWLQRLEGLIATAIRIDTMLGLDRRPKDEDLLNLNAADYARANRVQTSARESEDTDA